MRFPPERAWSGLPERQLVQGEVMSPVTVSVRWIESGPLAGWRLFASGSQFTLREQTRAIREKGRALGGTYDQAMTDAQRICRENGFVLERPSRLIVPS